MCTGEETAVLKSIRLTRRDETVTGARPVIVMKQSGYNKAEHPVWQAYPATDIYSIYTQFIYLSCAERAISLHRLKQPKVINVKKWMKQMLKF